MLSKNVREEKYFKFVKQLVFQKVSILLIMIMNSITSRTNIKKSVQKIQDIDTQSQSSKGLDDFDTEITGASSERTLNLFQDDCDQKNKEFAINEPKQNRKNHIFIRMSARINGVQFSPDNVKSNQLYQTYQKANNKLQGFKKVPDKNLNNSKIFQKIIEKQSQIIKLQQENKRLIVENEQLKRIGTRKNFRSTDRLSFYEDNPHQDIRICKQQQISNPYVQKLKIEQQLVKIQQIKNHLEKRVLDLEVQISNRDINIKEIMKQSQYEINLLYENLSKRLKARQLQSYMNGKQLKQQKQKSYLLEQSIFKLTEQKQRYESLFSNCNKQKQQLMNNIRLQEQQLRKNKILSFRLQHCETQLKYSHQQLKKSKQQQSEQRLQNKDLTSELLKVKKQLSNLLSKNSSYAQITALRSSLQLKQEQVNKFRQNNIDVERVYKQLEILSIKHKQIHNLLEQANEQIMKLNIRVLNNVIPKKGY